MTQLLLESMEDIGTIRDQVAEHDIKWPGLAAKSLCRCWGRSLPSLTCSCCFTGKSPPEFICCLPVTAVLLECSSSPRPGSVRNINFHSISRSGSAPSDQRQTLGLMEEAWGRTGHDNKNHAKWTPEGELAGQEGLESDSAADCGSQTIGSLTRVFRVLQKPF